MNTKISLMALGKIQESREVVVKRYIGVGAVNVLAVNPTREELNKIFGSNNTNPVEYVGTRTVNVDDKEVEVPTVRVSFIVKTDPKIACNNGIEMTQFVSFNIAKCPRISKTGKVQVIDKYGRNMWLDRALFDAKQLPEGARLDKEYRAAYAGEVDLIANIRAFLNIPSADKWDNDQQCFVPKTDPKELADCLVSIDNWDAMFKGDVSEVKDAMLSMPSNAYKLMFGVRTKDDGTQQQAVYTQMPLALAVTSFKALQRSLSNDLVAGAHPDTVYKAESLQEYVVKPSDYSGSQNVQESDLPDANDDLPFETDTNPFAGM